MRTTMAGTGLIVSLLAFSIGCGQGGGASKSATSTSTSASTSGSTWSYPLPKTTASGPAATTTSASSGSSSSSAPGGASATLTASAGATLAGTIPPDPATGFGGSLFLVGTRLSPGSVILVSYQGTLIKGLPTQFYSSELLAMQVFLTIPGDYSFAALAPDGTTSTAIALHVPSGGAQGAFTLQTPSLQMAFPTSLDTSFTGTMWLLGEHFMPGSTLLVSYAGAPEVAMPLLFTNERTVGWVTATPVTGTMTIRVMNPTFIASTPVTLQVGMPSSGAGKPAPTLLAPPHAVTTPFLGVLRVFGGGFQAGATLELTDLASGATSTSGLLFVSSAEVWWELAYPSSGTYDALVRNPDGQATPSFHFQVR